MITSKNISEVQNRATANLNRYFTSMIIEKSSIQREIIPLTSEDERDDIRYSRLNTDVVDKLARIGKIHFQISSDKSDEMLFCICMAIGTNIKEYEWGTSYVLPDGLCELANKITR